MRRALAITPFDGLLLLMVLIWGSNYSVIKASLTEILPQAFNALRLVIASAVFAAAMLYQGWPRIAPRDWLRLAALGVVGHFVYQLCFMGGIARTSASNSSLIIGCSPVAVALASAVAGHERVPRAQWAGVLLSVVGVYFVVGGHADFGAESMLGDMLTLCAVACWAVYTVGARPLLARYSPLAVTGLTMLIGMAVYVPATMPELRVVKWDAVHPWAWAALVLSALLALNLAYLIWYTSVQRIGNIRTSVYSNIIPLVAMSVAALTLGERLTGRKIAGAACVLSGVALTRFFAQKHTEPEPPAEE